MSKERISALKASIASNERARTQLLRGRKPSDLSLSELGDGAILDGNLHQDRAALASLEHEGRASAGHTEG